LVELQVGLKILPIGVAEAGAWRRELDRTIVTPLEEGAIQEIKIGGMKSPQLASPCALGRDF
jgi:hypothetical protein